MNLFKRRKQPRKQGPFARRWSRLNVRITISHIVLSVFNVLLFEFLLGLFVMAALMFSPLLDIVLQPIALQTARSYASAAKLQGGGVSLNPSITFQPDQPFSIAPPSQSKHFSGQPSIFDQQIFYTNASAQSASTNSFALLISPNAYIFASSYPDRYPTLMQTTRLLPTQTQHILTALKGQEYTSVADMGQTHIASVVEPIWNNDNSRVIGAIYLQISWTISETDFLRQGAKIWFFSGLIWLIIIGPPGAFLGMLTTRGLVRRIHRLVEATVKFANGDYTQQVPVKKRDEIGQLELQFNQMAEQLVENIAQRQALAEQNARVEERARIEQEMHSARYIQQTLLPKEKPVLPGWQIEAYYGPAREVGGDFYDFLPLGPNRLGLVIGDATDKGMAAALLMATTCTMLRTAAQEISSPATVLTRVNDLLYATIPSGMFATCFYAILGLDSGRLRYANAGHDWPYQCQANKVVELSATGMPLGMLPGTCYDEHEVLIAPGESIFFYSDGLTEAHNAQREMFDLPRLKASLGKYPGGPNLINDMRDELIAFTGKDWKQEDDVTMVVLYRTPDLSTKGICPQNTLHLLSEWNIASSPGHERQVSERVASIIEPLSLSSTQVENLKTAVAETVMNAVEHGNQYQLDKPVTIQILADEIILSVRILDEGEEKPITEPEVPDINAKLASLQ